MLADPRFERIAHRGSPRELVENTLPGFLLALQRGADAIELDVHVTRDGEVVVHHDPDVQGVAITETRWPEIAALDLGSGARVPRLADVLDAVADRATVYVEVKGAQCEDAVLPVVRRHGTRYALHSFDHAVIERLARAAPDVPRGLLFPSEQPNVVTALRDAVKRTGARDVWPHWTLVDAHLVRAASQLGARVLCWTVNSADKARRLADLGVAGVCTDDVRLLAKL